MCLYNPSETEMNFKGLLYPASTIQKNKKVRDGNTQNNNIIPKTWELQGPLVYLI